MPGSGGGEAFLASPVVGESPVTMALTLGLGGTLVGALAATQLLWSGMTSRRGPTAEVNFAAVAEPRPLLPLELFIERSLPSALSPPLGFSLAEADAVSRRSAALLSLGSNGLRRLLREHRRSASELAEELTEEVTRHRPNPASLRALDPENYAGELPWLGWLLKALLQRPRLGPLLLSLGALGTSYALRTALVVSLNTVLPGLEGVLPVALSSVRRESIPPAVPAGPDSGKGSLAAEALDLLLRALESLAQSLRSWSSGDP